MLLVVGACVCCRVWVDCIRWVIFDEVHCISELAGGDVWERLLLAVRWDMQGGRESKHTHSSASTRRRQQSPVVVASACKRMAAWHCW